MMAKKDFTIQLLILTCICSMLPVFSQIAQQDKDSIFKRAVRYYIGPDARSITGADLNGDKATDLISASMRSNQIFVLFNNGDGSFTNSSTYSVEQGPIAIRASDLNSDGATDLVILCFSASKISIALNMKKGSFRVVESHTIDGYPTDLCVADFNSDRKPDIATLSPNLKSISMLYNSDSGNFKEAIVVAKLQESALRMSCADLNNDRKTDLVAASKNRLFVILNSGLNFRVGSTINADPPIESIYIDDFNGDGQQDLAVLSSNSGLNIFINSGKGTFQKKASYKAGNSPNILTSLDINQDLKHDVVIADKVTKSLYVFFNRGDGSFDIPTKYSLNKEVSAMFASDLNADKATDLSFVSSISGDLTILLNNYKKR